MHQDLIDFCANYNLPIEHLGSILKDPKVIPMIRGKAFEFSACDYLKTILSDEVWEVTKPFMNAQANQSDEDVLITHIETSTRITIECKLSAKGMYSYQENTSIFKIKCMRSRTLGIERVRALAAFRQTDEGQLSTHNDQYLPNDFDLVLTTLANAFYQTDSDGIFVWSPSVLGQNYLESKFGRGLTTQEYQNKAFYDMYIAKASDLVVSQYNDVTCTRRRCTNINDCGYIPNYPILRFDHDDLHTSINDWVHITDIEQVLMSFI